MKHSIYIFLLVYAAIISGCATHTSFTFEEKEEYQSVVKGNEVDPAKILISTGDIEDKIYTLLGRLKVSVNKTTVFHSDPTIEQVNMKLKDEASKIGADAVINVIYDGPKITLISWGTLDGECDAVKYED